MTTNSQHFDHRYTVVRRKHVARWVVTLLCLVLLAMLVHTLVVNSRFGWPVVGQWLFSGFILDGVRTTLVLTVLSMVIGIGLGVLLAVMRMTRHNPLASSLAAGYVWFFRGTPLLVQLIFWYNIATLFPRLSLGVPFGPQLVSAGSNTLVTPMLAAVFGLGLNEAAYMAEIVRGGLLSVDQGQQEAALAVGMTPGQTMWRIVLPQSMRIIIPPTGNSVIGMLKFSALASVISVTELLNSAQLIYSRNFQTIPLLIVASIWYIVLSTVLSIGQHYVERHFGRGATTVNSSQPLSVRAARMLGFWRRPPTGRIT